MKRATDKLIALQFLAVVLPIAAVLLVQMVVDAHRAEALEYSRPFKILSAEARANYMIFANGALDAAASGVIAAQSLEALQTATVQLTALAQLGQSIDVTEAATLIADLESTLTKDGTLSTIRSLRPRIERADVLTAAINDDFNRRDDEVVKDALASAAIQRDAVVGALTVSTALTVVFVLRTRRRLKDRMDAEIAAERQRRNELETMSVRFGIATRVAGAGVYDIKKDSGDLWWSDNMYELYSRSPREFRPAISCWLDLIHPDDRQSARTAITTAMHEHGQLRSQYRVMRPDGSVRHIASVGTMVADSIDSISRLVGIDIDITERVEADERERKLQQQLRESSRQAGMAEIAVNVLHNIGNVLNSVNISATVVADRIKASKASSLSKVAALVRDNAADLGGFVSNDPRGKYLPMYLTQLSEQLETDQRATVHELDLLRKNIEHIKEIVVMQQSYSKLTGTPEKLTVVGLVEEALRLDAGTFTRKGVIVNCAFEDVPEIVAEKHKVLQILINLLRNAKYACEASPRTDKRVMVSISPHGDGVRIGVADNGIGILPEHMTQIFRHGFTTKKDGHGFGLHSGALAALDLGGALRVASDGLGCGATFTLELPLTSPEIVRG